MSEPLSIIVDTRGEPDYIVSLIKFAKVIRQAMPVADYQIKDILVERKEISDFFNSLVSGRIWDQCYNMMKTAEENQCKAVIVIIGDVSTFDFRNKCPAAWDKVSIDCTRLETFCLVSYLSYGIPVFRVRTDEDFVKLLENIYTRRTKQVSMKPVPKKASTPEDIKSDILVSIPSIGRKVADYLAKNYSIIQLANLPIDNLSEVKVDDRRIASKAYKIHEALNK